MPTKALLSSQGHPLLAPSNVRMLKVMDFFRLPSCKAHSSTLDLPKLAWNPNRGLGDTFLEGPGSRI